jgi:hypothetical protein
MYEPRWMSLAEYARVSKAYGPADVETPRSDGVYVYWKSPVWVSINDLRFKQKRGFIYNLELLKHVSWCIEGLLPHRPGNDRVVAGYAPNPALPGFPALFARLKEVFDLVLLAHSALAAGATSEVERHLGQILELLSSFNLMAMWDAALQCVEIFAHPLFVPGQDTRVQPDLASQVVGATSMVEAPLSDL